MGHEYGRWGEVILRRFFNDVYNAKRLRSSLNYTSSEEFEATYGHGRTH